MLTVALYARVSSERQVQGNTVASQLSAIENQIRADGHKLLDKYKFVDDGYSGSNLVRPALEKLRDKIAEHKIDIIYIHSPDRLSRKYSYQMVLLEEFQKVGAEVKFLNHNINDSPESHLLLQMQGMIAEYEHAKITERCRRGKIYSANKGYVNVMSRAPYGYRYITKYMGNGQAFFEIHKEEAEIIRKMFFWIGRERISIREVCDRLNAMSILTQTGKTLWNKAVVFRMLKNTAYKGLAAFGKRKVGPKLPSVRPPKHSCEQPRYNASIYPTDKKHWIYIPVPNIVSEDLFDEIQEQLAENRKQLRHIGTKYLLQGLVVCQCCRYAYCGTSKRKEHGEIGYCRGYYYCIGTGPSRFGGNRVCNNKSIYADVLETTVWEEVKYLLKNPNRILEEYQNRILETERLLHNQDYHFLKKREDKLKRGISRLIDGYAQEYISQEEFEPRIKAMKQNLKTLEEQKKKIFDQQNLQQKLTSIIVNIEEFSSRVESSLDKPDFLTKRDIIRALVKRIEISLKNVNIVFRVKETPYPTKYKEKAYDKFQQRYTSSYYGNTNSRIDLVAGQARLKSAHA